MKRTVSAALALFIALTAAACGKSPEVRWQEQLDLGTRYMTEGDYEEAVLAFEAAIEIDPARADAYRGLAEAYMALGRTSDALEVLDQAQEEVEDARELLDLLGFQQEILEGMIEEARKDIEDDGPDAPEAPDAPEEPETPEEPEPSMDLLEGVPYTGDRASWHLGREQAAAFGALLEDIPREEGFPEGGELYAALVDCGEGGTALWVCAITFTESFDPRSLDFGNGRQFVRAFERVYRWDGRRAVPVTPVDNNEFYVNLRADGLELYTVDYGFGMSGGEWDAFYPFAGGTVAQEVAWCRAWLRIYNMSLDQAGIPYEGRDAADAARDWLDSLITSGQWPDLPYDPATLTAAWQGNGIDAGIRGGMGFEALYGDDVWPRPGQSGNTPAVQSVADIREGTALWRRAGSVAEALVEFANR